MWFFFVLFEQKIEIEQILIQKYTRYKKNGRFLNVWEPAIILFLRMIILKRLVLR
jgi:hypothetical protein